MLHWTSLIVSRVAPNFLPGAVLDRLAEELAEQALPAVLLRSRSRAAKMRSSEARGYVRARAALVVRERVDAELQHRPAAQAKYRLDLIERATEAVISLALGELSTRQIGDFRPALAA